MKVIFQTILVTFVMLTADAGAEIYKWVDEEGNVHYSDCPPPPDCDTEVVETISGPSDADVARAKEQLDALLSKQEASKAIREQDRLEKERQRNEAIRIAVEMKRTCIMARQNLRVLLMKRPVFYIDETGKEVYLDDETHKAEIARMRGLIADNCVSQ